MDRPVTSVVGVGDVPEGIRSLSTMNEPDYVDMFTMAATTEARAETWARAMYEDTLGVRGRLIFSVVLGFELERATAPSTVAGWRIAEHGEDWIRMEAEGSRLAGQIVVRAVEGQLSVATFIKDVSRLGSVLWTLWATLHRRAMPGVVRKAAGIVEN